MSQPNGIYIILPIWGSRHVEHFLSVSWPGLQRNMALLKVPPTLMVYTQEADAQRLREVLGPHSHIIVLPDSEIQGQFVGTLMTKIHQLGLDKAFLDGCAIMPICSDIVYGDDGFNVVNKVIEQSKRVAIVTAGGMAADLYLTFRKPGEPITCRELATFQLKVNNEGYTHPTRWDSKPFPAHPAIVQWCNSPHGYLDRRFHAHPLYIFPRVKHQMIWSVDNDLIENSGLTVDEMYWVEDSDEFFFIGCEISDGGAPHAGLPDPDQSSPEYWAQWASSGWARDFGWECVKHHFYIHDGSFSPIDKQLITEQSDAIVNATCALRTN